MRQLLGSGIVIAVGLTLFGPVGTAFGQETAAAKKTRGRLKETISLDLKDTGIKDVFEEIKREMNNKVSFKIKNETGVSNNTKLSYKCDNKTLAQVLDDICTINDMGYFVLSQAGDRLDGWIIIRKSKGKERGYEQGKEPKAK